MSLRTSLPTMTAAIALVIVNSAEAQQGALTLHTAIAEALEHSPVLRVPADDVARAEIRARLAASQFEVKIAPSLSTTTDPIGGNVRSVGLSMSKALSTGGRAWFSATSLEFTNPVWGGRDSGYTAGVSQPLLSGWHSTQARERDLAKRAVAAGERRLAAARDALVVRVAAQYVAVCKQQRMAASAAQGASRARTLREAAEARTRVGLATELDVVRATIFETQMAAALADAGHAAAETRDELLILIGRRNGAAASEVDVAEPDLAALTAAVRPGAAGIDELIGLALASRPEVEEARARLRDARRSADAARWDRLPPLSLDVSYTARGVGAAPGTVFSAMPDGWRVSLNTAHTLDRGAASAAADSARLSIAAAEQDLRDVEQRLAVEIRRLHRAWVTTGSVLDLQRHAAALAARERELAELRCERGLATTLEVIEAHENERRAGNAKVAAELDRIVVALDLLRATGDTSLEQIWR